MTKEIALETDIILSLKKKSYQYYSESKTLTDLEWNDRNRHSSDRLLAMNYQLMGVL